VQEKILFIDDEPLVLEGFQRLLRGAFQIETTVSAADALAKLKHQGTYAAVVCDMRMPEMDGARLLSKIRVDFPDVVRIMLTGNSDQETAVRAVNEGHIFRFLTKPCDEELLKSTLNAAMIQYRITLQKEDLLEKARGGRSLPPETRNYQEYQILEQRVREILSRDAVTSLPTESGVYFGTTICENTDFLVQRITQDKAIAHPKSRLSTIPRLGEFVRIEYTGGAGEVASNSRR
jgi:DNA-binding NtrC family response regulator